jgi:phosphoserine phosphatase
VSLVVDLCGTLISENTTRGFIRWISAKGERRFCAKLGLSRGVSWIDSRAGSDIGRRLQVFSTKGLSRELLYVEGAKYVRERLRTHANPRVLAAIHEAQAQGACVYLATASLDPIAYAVRVELGLTDVVCSHLLYNHDGICAGKLVVDTLGRKWSFLSPLVAADDGELVVYTDNPEDEDLMAKAARVYFLGDTGKIRSVSLSKFSFIERV